MNVSALFDLLHSYFEILFHFLVLKIPLILILLLLFLSLLYHVIILPLLIVLLVGSSS